MFVAPLISKLRKRPPVEYQTEVNPWITAFSFHSALDWYHLESFHMPQSIKESANENVVLEIRIVLGNKNIFIFLAGTYYKVIRILSSCFHSTNLPNQLGSIDKSSTLMERFRHLQNKTHLQNSPPNVSIYL